MELLEKKPRFVPCPYCHGAGGHTEIVPGLGDGPHYDCTACDGSGNLHDYVRLKAEREARWAFLETKVCDCGHHAGEHYDGFDHCAADLGEQNGTIPLCPCTRSQEAVIAL